MYVFRPVKESDLGGLATLARSTGGGLTTLPPDASFLESRILDAQGAFHPRVAKPGGEYYLFVLQDTDSGELVGTAGISARVGGFDPWYSYEIRKERFTHAPLGIDKEVATLHLKKEHRGPSEVCSLFLRADCRRRNVGRLLSLTRFLFMAAFPQRFTTTVIAEMRGFSNPTGKSPFWEAVGRHFFEHDYYAADVLCGLGDKQFIADLMPRHPIYVPLLPTETQQILGRVHPDTEAALALLRSEGFSEMGEIDIFDAGPLVHTDVARVRTIRQSRRATIGAVVPAPPDPEAMFLVSNGKLDFRGCLASIGSDTGETAAIDEQSAGALGVAPGDAILFSPVR